MGVSVKLKEKIKTFILKTDQAPLRMGSTKKPRDAVPSPMAKNASISTTLRNSHSNENASDADVLQALVTDALDPDKPSKFDVLSSALDSFDTSDEDMGRLFQLLLVDGSAAAGMRSDFGKRFINMLLRAKWAGRGKKTRRVYGGSCCQM